MGYNNVYRRSEEDKIYGGFHYLLNFYGYKENCVTALKKLNKITVDEKFLERDDIKEWTIFHEWLGSKKMLAFLTDHNADFENCTLEITGLKIFVELKPFMPLVVFSEVFQILYCELQLHLPEDKRKFDNPGDYYTQQDPLPAHRRVKDWWETVFVD